MAGLVESRHDVADAPRALFHRNRGIRSAHVRANPTGMHDDGKAAPLAPTRRQLAKPVVECRLRGAVLPESEWLPAPGARLAGNQRDLPLPASRHRVHERLDDLYGGLGVDAAHRGAAHSIPVDAGVVDQHIDRLAFECIAKGADLRFVGHIQAVDVDVAANIAECSRTLRCAGCRMHPPTLARILLHETQANPSARSNDRRSRHRGSSRLTALPTERDDACCPHPHYHGRATSVRGASSMIENVGGRAAIHCGTTWRSRRSFIRRSFLAAAAAITVGTAGHAQTAGEYAEMRRGMMEAIAGLTLRTAPSTGVEVIDAAVMDALERVPRHEFVRPEDSQFAYENHPLRIGYGQTISQPYIVALMTHLLAPAPRHRVLEVGTGSGYQAAVLADLVDRVHTIEIVPELARQATERLPRLGYDNVEVRLGDGYHGWPENAPFNAIIVTAAASHVPPPLVDQLARGGALVIPVGEPFSVQMLLLVQKGEDGAVSVRQILPVQFVPLTGGN